MAKHKAAAEITIVTQERSALGQFVDRYKFHFFAGALAFTGGILFYQARGRAVKEDQKSQWAVVYAALGGKSTGANATAQLLEAEALQRAAANLGTQPAADWARMLAAYGHAENEKFGDAREVALQLEKSGGKLVNGFTLPLGKDGAEVTLADHLSASIEATEAFEQRFAHLFKNPAPAPDAPVVVLETSKGNIEIALYSDRAPRHVENFLKLTREGYYDGTKFHRSVKDFMIQGGDGNTKEGAPETWGQGGPAYKLDREESGLVHLPMYLAAAKMPGEVQSSGSQFYITTGSPHHLDGEHVVYGKVVAGEDVVRTIESGAPDPTNGERPLEPVTVTRATVKGE